MKVEIPELKRCCFCIPLRYGLIGWGYIKMIPLLAMIGTGIDSLVRTFTRSHLIVEEFLVISTFILIVTLDLCFTIVFIVGGHRKSAKMLHTYYIYNIVFLCFNMVFLIWLTASELYYLSRYIDHLPYGNLHYIPVIQMRVLFGTVNIGIQVYIILLIRSEALKLRNCSKYRFSNPAAEDTLENGTNGQEINNPKGESNRIGTDSQFEGIINQTTQADNKSFDYNKF